MATTKKNEDEILRDAMKRVEQEQAQHNDAPPEPDKKAPAASKAKAPPRQAKATVTYIPLDDGDMPFTTWHRVKFKANVPVEVTNPAMIEAAKTNPWFSVDGAPPAKRVIPAKPRDTSEDVRSVSLSKSERELELDEVGDLAEVSGTSE